MTETQKTQCKRCKLIQYFLGAVVIAWVWSFAAKDDSLRRFSISPGESYAWDITQSLPGDTKIDDSASVRLRINKNPIASTTVSIQEVKIKQRTLYATLHFSTLPSAKPGQSDSTEVQFLVNAREMTPPLNLQINVVK